jgi:hypothetical protein
LKNHDENAKKKSEKSERKSYSKWGMQDVHLYAQIPFILPEGITGHSPAFGR